MKRIMAVAAMAVLAASSCTPAVTITMTAPRTAVCGYYIETLAGEVLPSDSMTSVVIQRQTAGKWSDWLWYKTPDDGETAAKLIAQVWGDEWSIQPRVPVTAGEVLTLRARASAAAGGTKVVSNSVTITVVKPPAPARCPRSLS